MSRSKPTFFLLLRLFAVISIAGPALVFAYATWQSHRSIDTQANERIERALDVVQEHALKAVQTVERSISEINEALRGLPDETIRVNESDLFLRLKRTQQALPQMESIWVFDRTGSPLVSSTILPVPRDLDDSDRSYFRAHRDSDGGTFIGEVVRARVGALRFFVVSARRQSQQPGRFDGVIGVTVMPEHFSEFYRKLSRGGDAFALLREDGGLLARYPETRVEPAVIELPNGDPAARQAGLLTVRSQIDGIERRTGFRKVPGLPLYVTAGIETAELRREFWSTALVNLAIGLPVSLALFALAVIALRSAERFRDETARREAAETALKQSQRLEAVGRLTGGIAHDFNNLLMVVGGNADRLRRQAPSDDRTRRALEAIDIAVKRGANLTRQLLSFSRQQAYEARIVDLRERVPVMRGMLEASLRGDISVETRIPGDTWLVSVDIGELELALLNLAVNARDAMSNGGILTISARNLALARPNDLGLEGDVVALAVTDTGTGIPPEIVGRVFDPFFTTKDVGKGTGLGLSQVYGFAHQAGGTATIDTEPGRGTTVTLFLPRAGAGEVPAADMQSAATSAGPAARSLQVLVVEDNAEVAEVTRGYLEEAGCTVRTVTTVEAALAVLRDAPRRHDLVLSDIVMPGGANGLDLARWIRQEHGSRPAVVLTTGYSDKALAAADEGFTILRKPYDAATLRTLLAQSVRPQSQVERVGVP